MNKTKRIVLCALHFGLIFISTYLLKIPNGLQGYIHLGDVFILLYANIASPFYACVACGGASMLADLVAGYSIYMIPTFFIKAIEALIVIYLTRKIPNKKLFIYILAASFMVLGYFIFESVIYDYRVAILSIPANLIQASASIFLCKLVISTYTKQLNQFLSK